jgi:hypothetical protein
VRSWGGVDVSVDQELVIKPVDGVVEGRCVKPDFDPVRFCGLPKVSKTQLNASAECIADTPSSPRTRRA